ncbi:hypothetical protein ABKA04_007042 [Annulohypoxylon sp. FPYF3050]
MRFSILSIVAAWIVGATSLAIQNTTSLATLNSTIYDETPPPSVDGDHRICIPTGQPNPGLNSTYDCGGSIMCNTVKVVWCDKGINHKLIRNDDLNYGAIGFIEVGSHTSASVMANSLISAALSSSKGPSTAFDRVTICGGTIKKSAPTDVITAVISTGEIAVRPLSTTGNPVVWYGKIQGSVLDISQKEEREIGRTFG